MLFLWAAVIAGNGMDDVKAEENSRKVYSEDKNFEYILINDGKEVEVYYSESGVGGNVVIPSTIEGKPVTSIGMEAFGYCKDKLTAVTIPSSVTQISTYAFAACNKLTAIDIPASVTTIGMGAFTSCTSLTTLTIPGNVKTLGMGAFNGCEGLTSLTISEGVEVIGWGAFGDCSGLTAIEIPSSVTSIGDEPFSGSNLTSIKVDEQNTKYDSRNNCNAIIETATDKLVSGCKNTIIPTDVKSIGMGAFGGCVGLETIVIPESVKDIGSYVFSDCTGLKEISLPEGITDIKMGTFEMCSSLKSVSIPSGVTSIEIYAFSGCISLTDITIPDSVEDIADSAFSGCTSLADIKVGSNNPSYSTVDGVMYNNDKTTLISYPSAKGGKYTIPESVTSIEAGAFKDCNNLEEIVLSSKLTSISPEAFRFSSETDTTHNIKVTVPEEMDVSKLGLENIEAKDHVVIYVAEGSSADLYLAKYKLQITVITYPSKNGTKEEAKIGKTYEAGNAKYKVTSATEVTFTSPKSKSIKSLKIPDTVKILSKSYKVTAVSKRACKGCKKLTTVTVGKNVKTIGDEAFMNCKKLKKVTVGKSVTSIGKKVFSGDKKLAKLIFKGSKVKKVGKKALSGVPKKVKITAPKKAVPKYKKLLNKAK